MITELEFSMQNVFQLAELEKVCFGRDAWTINNLRGEYENDFSHFIAWLEGDKIVGYVCVRIMYEEAQVCNIAVLPEYRRQGIATALLKEMLAFSKTQGCERAELEVNVCNEPAIGAYRKSGFEVAGTRFNFYRKTRYPSRDAYTMVCNLIDTENQ